MTDTDDVSRAFVLPEVVPPSDAALLSLALFWEQIVLPDYRERSHGADTQIVLTPVAERLRDEGVLVVADRRVDIDTLMPFARDGGLPGGLTLRVDDDLAHDLKLSAETDCPASRFPALLADDKGVPTQVHLDDVGLRRVVASHVSRHLLARVDDARSFAAREHLAPVACSRLSHLATLLGTPAMTEPLVPAALLTVAASSFRVRDGTSAEEVLRFREKAGVSRAAFRRGISDLAAGLQEETDPNRAMGRARDRYNNHVRPTLAELDEAVNVNRATFVTRSLVQLSAVALAPVTPTSAVVSGASFAAESISYRFSRRLLVSQHPYGYLHQLSSTLGADGRDNLPPILGADGDGETALRELILHEGIQSMAQRFLTDASQDRRDRASARRGVLREELG